MIIDIIYRIQFRTILFAKMDTRSSNLTEEQILNWINQLEQCTDVFYNKSSDQHPMLWKEAQSKLLQFQKLHEPFELCKEIIKRSRNQLVLYQTTLCLKNAVAGDTRKFGLDELLKLFQFLYEFMCSQALENDMSVNETTALIIAMIFKKISGEEVDVIVERIFGVSRTQSASALEDKIVLLCSPIKDSSENISKRVASAMMLKSLLLECQLTNRSTLIGLHIWKHVTARRLIETNLKTITEACLETINWAFSSNLLNPFNQTRETQILFHLVKTLIHCIENTLSFHSTNHYSFGEREIIRAIQGRTINTLSQACENDQRLKTLREWSDLVMSPNVVQLLFDLYATVKSMINCVPGWDWPSSVLKNCLNCLYYLSAIDNSVSIEKNEKYANFAGSLMMGAVKLMENGTQGVDDIYQIACLLTSISMHTSEIRDTITMIKAEHFIPFLDAAQRFTIKVFIHVASSSTEEEEEEEKTVDTLLDFWFHLLRNTEAEIRYCAATNPPQNPKISLDSMKGYARMITECYISCHLHRPLGQVVYDPNEIKEFDMDQAEDQDDNNIHNLQLVTFGLIGRFDALHTAKLLIDLAATRLNRLEEILRQYINTDTSPESVDEWAIVNDDIHWLLLMMQHFLTQTGYGEIGFMCNEILSASIAYEANVDKTLQGFETCDYASNDVDPIVRLILIAVKLCQIEIGICQSGKVTWLSSQTNITLTTLLSRFCLTYLYPKESDYTVISENMNHCFGQDSPTAEKFLKFVIEHSCWIIIHLKADQQVSKKNFQFLIQLTSLHRSAKDILTDCDDNPVLQNFIEVIGLSMLTDKSSNLSRHVVNLGFRLTMHDDLEEHKAILDKLWSILMKKVQNSEHQCQSAVNDFLMLVDMTIGCCEACDDETADRFLDEIILPIVKALPDLVRAFKNYESVHIAIFDLLYHVVKLPMVHIVTWDCLSAKTFYENCSRIIEAYAEVAVTKDRKDDEDDFEDIISVLTFCNEVMKHDWGNSLASCDAVVKFAMEQLGKIIEPRKHLQYPKIRSIYYRLLVYLVDEDERLANLSDRMLQIILESIVVGLESRYDKDVDSHIYTIISVICRSIYHEKGTPTSDRLAKYMEPVLPLLFEVSLNQGALTINNEAIEMMSPAIFALRCCFLDRYNAIVENIINKQEDPYIKNKVKVLFENFESRIRMLTLNRTACREFNSMFVPFMAELYSYVAIR